MARKADNLGLSNLLKSISDLQSENTMLRAQNAEMLEVFNQLGAALNGDRPRRGRPPTAATRVLTTDPDGNPTLTTSRSPRGRTRAMRRTSSAKRASNAALEHLTPDVLRAAIGKIGGSVTAAQIAAVITEGGTSVNGRQLRFRMEKIPGVNVVSEGNVRHYSLG